MGFFVDGAGGTAKEALAHDEGFLALPAAVSRGTGLASRDGFEAEESREATLGAPATAGFLRQSFGRAVAAGRAEAAVVFGLCADGVVVFADRTRRLSEDSKKRGRTHALVFGGESRHAAVEAARTLDALATSQARASVAATGTYRSTGSKDTLKGILTCFAVQAPVRCRVAVRFHAALRPGHTQDNKEDPQ